jgi:hypothetical protein
MGRNAVATAGACWFVPSGVRSRRSALDAAGSHPSARGLGRPPAARPTSRPRRCLGSGEWGSAPTRSRGGRSGARCNGFCNGLLRSKGRGCLACARARACLTAHICTYPLQQRGRGAGAQGDGASPPPMGSAALGRGVVRGADDRRTPSPGQSGRPLRTPRATTWRRESAERPPDVKGKSRFYTLVLCRRVMMSDRAAS